MCVIFMTAAYRYEEYMPDGADALRETLSMEK